MSYLHVVLKYNSRESSWHTESTYIRAQLAFIVRYFTDVLLPPGLPTVTRHRDSPLHTIKRHIYVEHALCQIDCDDDDDDDIMFKNVIHTFSSIELPVKLKY